MDTYKLASIFLCISTLAIILAFLWACEQIKKRRDERDELSKIIKQFHEANKNTCASCGLIKTPIFRGYFNEPICSEDCKEVYKDYIIEISQEDKS